jgi:5-formyltetrahydrofolate cyclo-ligase
MTESKASYRNLYTLARSHIGSDYAEKAAALISKRFLKHIPLTPGAVIAAYMPIGHELDILPLMHALHGLGYSCAMPAIVGSDLVFRKWEPESVLVNDPVHNIPEPLASAEIMVPDILITPLLACTSKGIRLGYGKGFYDRILKKLRSEKDILAVGACFACQLADTLPSSEWDQPLDRVITEKALYECAATKT